RGIDAAFALDRPFRRVSDWGHVAVLGTTAYCVATDRAPDVSKAMFYANMGLLGTSFGDWLYQQAVGAKVAQIRATKIAERITAGTKTGASAGNPLATAQSRALLQAGTQRARGYVVNDTKR
ncbi:MAG: hypothetical protein JRD89_20685, partial [Deltaproteobacteria bacterium]|nr:hypothetical protein [Deltaproteobacteria bacterium]